MERIKMSTAEKNKLRGSLLRELPKDELDFLIRNIYLSIEAELRDSAYYRALADIAPDQFAADMIMEFNRDERTHAYELQQAYEGLTGKAYTTPEELEFEFNITDYQAALEERVLDETADYKKYKSYYLMTANPVLRDIFFNAMVDESYHATRELYLLHRQMLTMVRDHNDC